MEPEEIKCFIILCILAGITIVIVNFFSFTFIESYPLNIYFILIVLMCDVILSGYVIKRTSKIVKRKTKRNKKMQAVHELIE